MSRGGDGGILVNGDGDQGRNGGNLAEGPNGHNGDGVDHGGNRGTGRPATPTPSAAAYDVDGRILPAIVAASGIPANSDGNNGEGRAKLVI